MNNMDTTGSYMAIAGLLAALASKYFGLEVTTEAVVQILAAIFALIGIYKQWKAHQTLGQAYIAAASGKGYAHVPAKKRKVIL